jgi:hypothetical protein
MKKLLMGLAALPFATGVAMAGQPLTDQQMDRVTAGYASQAIADALGKVGESGIILTTTATLSQVDQVATGRLTLPGGLGTSEGSSTLYKSVAGAQAASVSYTYSPGAIPNLIGP